MSSTATSRRAACSRRPPPPPSSERRCSGRSLCRGAHPVAKDAEVAEHLLNRTWRPALSVIGADGLPPTAVAGNVMLPQTNSSCRSGCHRRSTRRKRRSASNILTRDPPQGARIVYEGVSTGNGYARSRRNGSTAVRRPTSPTSRRRTRGEAARSVHVDAARQVPQRAVPRDRAAGPGSTCMPPTSSFTSTTRRGSMCVARSSRRSPPEGWRRGPRRRPRGGRSGERGRSAEEVLHRGVPAVGRQAVSVRRLRLRHGWLRHLRPGQGDGLPAG